MLSILSLAVAILPLTLAAPGAELEKRTAGNLSLDLYVHWKLLVKYLKSSAHSTCTGTGIAFLDSPGADDLYTENNAGVAGDFGHQAAYILCTTCTAC
ncbi:hypothetical protein VSDG_01295 [Cytospora chrysosperma]|uniref:Killer toxin Kp4 domain-containing protein n=1 Tax=Cytospora chrysosperma TaxID=252740 RepID=A0A423WIN9_CYTCH|nr:hypothetical protein VSDG_01295 [Valsa sordida]